MTTSPPPVDDTRRDWVSFEHDDDTYLFDATFLMSPWRCIFGEGCKGVLDEDATDLVQGCCSFGSHFADGKDRTRTRKAAARLTKEQWQFKSEAKKLGGPIAKNEEKEWTTRVHDGACIFLNRPDFHRGPGCALHVGALDAGERPMDWKPEVCWQLPLRLTHEVDDVDHTIYTLREWKRRDWGEGGQEFHWWCTDSPEAFVDPEPVVVTLRDDIIGLVGEAVYDRLRSHLGVDDGPAATVTWLPHPALRKKA